jgi:hypothetical protein
MTPGVGAPGANRADGVSKAYGEGFMMVAAVYLLALLAAAFMRSPSRP